MNSLVFITILIISIVIFIRNIVITIAYNNYKFLSRKITTTVLIFILNLGIIHISGSNYLYLKNYEDDWKIIKNNNSILDAFIDTTYEIGIEAATGEPRLTEIYELLKTDIYNSANIFNNTEPKSELGKYFKYNSSNWLKVLRNTSSDKPSVILLYAYCMSEIKNICAIKQNITTISFYAFREIIFLLFIVLFLSPVLNKKEIYFNYDEFSVDTSTFD